MLTTLEGPRTAVTDQPAAPHAALYALMDRPRHRWLRLDRRWVAEAVVGVVALTLAIAAFTLAGHF